MNPNNKDDNKTYRTEYRHKYIQSYYIGWLHLLFTLSFSTGIVIWSIAQLEDVTLWQYTAIPVVFLYANLVEYFAHKGPMHKPKVGLKLIYKRHATQHHIFFTHNAMQFDSSRDFKAVLFPPILIVFFFGLFALPVGLLSGWMFSDNVQFLFIATALSYFAIYEVLHTLYHINEKSWVYRIPFLKAMRNLHQNHHDVSLMSHYNFNITFPIGDLLFGTYYSNKSEE